MKKTIIFTLILTLLYGSNSFAHDIGHEHDDIWQNQMDITQLSLEKAQKKIQEYKTKKNFLIEKERYAQILERKYKVAIVNFDNEKKTKIMNKIENVIENYEQNNQIDIEKRERFLSLLHALEDLVSGNI